MREWISTQAHIPPENVWVLVWMDYGDVEFNRIVDGEWEQNCGTPTHWIPLPEPPKD